MNIGSLLPLIGGGLGGLFGGDEPDYGPPELPDEIKRILALLMKDYNAVQRESRSVPGSAPGEMAAMAQAQALAGQQQAGSRDALFAGMRPGDANGYGDALKGLGAMQSQQSAGINSSMLMDFLNSRKQLRFGVAPGILGQAAQTANSGYYRPQNTQNGFAGLAPALGQLAYWQTMQRGMGGGMRDPITGRGLQAGDSLGTVHRNV